jgi:predicted glycosyltransferase
MQYRNCFDFAVIAGGYNSVHESVFLRLPSIILPNTETGNDDQLTRALQAAETGGFIVIEKEDYDFLDLGLERICDDSILSNMLESMAEKDVTIDGAPYLAKELLLNSH